MFIIGITGGIGCGKSSVAKACKEYGLEVIDADQISREVTQENGAAITEIAQVFGSKIINEEGSLNRDAMSKLVFKNKKSLDILSAIVHKYVIEEMRKKIEVLNQKKIKAAVLDVPIPVKNGFIDVCDQIWVVWADDDIRIKRLNDRGMTTEDAKRRILCQMTKEEYENLADHVIYNNDSIEKLNETVKELLDDQLHMRGIKIKQ